MDYINYNEVLKDLTSGKKAWVIVKEILERKYGDLGVLFTKKDLTLDEWKLASGTEDVYYSCKNIATELYQFAITFDKIKK